MVRLHRERVRAGRVRPRRAPPRLAAGERDARHWHVDYLLGHPDATVETVVRTSGADVECSVGRALAAAEATERVGGFGASDCDCASHLVHAADGDALRRAAERAHGRDP